MTIQGGGGGPKVPPGGAKAPTTNPTTTTPAPPKTDPPKAAPAANPTSAHPHSDGFERGGGEPRLAGGAGVPADIATPSGINSMVRLLEETRSLILDEHRALREKSIKLISELARSGFDRALVDQKQQELTALRTRLAQLRKRLQQIQRRLKTALSKTTKHGDADVGKAIAAQLERMKRLEPGVQRALLALSAMEQAFSSVVDGGGALRLEGNVSAEDRGSALARLAPASVLARATVALLGGRAAKDVVDVIDVEAAPKDDGLQGLRSLANTLVHSLDSVVDGAPIVDAPTSNDPTHDPTRGGKP